MYRQRKVPFFAELSDAKLKAAWTASLQQFNDGDVICKKDDAGKAFYVVVSGRVDVEDVGSLKSGSYFGEISMLLQGQRQQHARKSADELGRSSALGLSS